MKKMIIKAKELIRRGEVKRISLTDNSNIGDMYEAGDEKVRIYKTPGVNNTSCTCKNFVRFNSRPRICYHIIACILFESNLNFYERLDQIIETYKTSQKIGVKIDLNYLILNLQDLKFLK